MKKFLYILCFMGLLFPLQSCDKIDKWLSNNPETTNNESTEETLDGNSSNTSVVDTSVSATGEKQNATQLQQLDSLVKVASDSLEVIKSNMKYLQQDLDKLKEEQKNLQDNKIDLKNLFVCLAVFFVIMLVVVVVLVKKLSLTDKDVKGIIKSIKPQLPQPQVSKKGSPVPNKNEELLRQEVSMLKKRVEVLERVEKAKSVNSQVQVTPPRAQVVTKPAKESNVFYMKRTLKENEFDLSLKCPSPNEDTFYRFEVDSRNRNLARFYFDCNSPAGVRWAFSTKDNTLDPVCKVGGVGRNGTYQCTAPGEARLEGGKWIVTRKAVVIFS